MVTKFDNFERARVSRLEFTRDRVGVILGFYEYEVIYFVFLRIGIFIEIFSILARIRFYRVKCELTGSGYGIYPLLVLISLVLAIVPVRCVTDGIAGMAGIH